MTSPDDATTRRIALAWRELRRGASGTALQSHLLGPDGPPLEQAQLDALEILASERGGFRMSEFADALRVDPSTATRAVSRLERHGLAERIAGEDDKRIVTARVTPQGRRMVERVGRLRSIGMQHLLAPFEPDEREQFAEYLERFVDSIDELVDELERAAADGNRP